MIDVELNKKTLLVDFSTLVIASAMSQRIDHVDEGLLRHLVINSILGARKKFQDHETVLCYDDRNYWRRKEFPGYKAHRSRARGESTFDWPSFYRYMDILKVEMKEIFPYKIIEVPGAEADDIIGTLSAYLNHPVVIYAEDGDFHQQLRYPNVRIYKPRKQVFVNSKPLHEIEYELFEKICTGDRGDGIPNVFSDINSFTDGTRQNRATSKRINDLFSNGLGSGEILERFKQNKLLIDLRETPNHIKEAIIEEYNKPPIGSKGKIFTYLASKKLNRHGANFMSDVNLF